MPETKDLSDLLDDFRSRLEPLPIPKDTKDALKKGLHEVYRLLKFDPPQLHVVSEADELSLEILRSDRRLGFSVEPDEVCWAYVESGEQRRIESGFVTADTDFSELVDRML